jgi:glycosyltransferase involved in cell wall biosynthesis
MSWLGRGPRYVFQAHGTAWAEAKNALRNATRFRLARFARGLVWTAIDCITYRRAANVVTVGPMVSDSLRARPYRWFVRPASLIEISNGIDADAFAADPTRRAEVRAQLGIGVDEVVAVSISRLVPQKGVDIYVEALAAAVAAQPSTALRLLIVGSGPAEDDLRVLASRLQVTNRITFTGAVDHSTVAELLAASDVFVFAPRGSGREGNPIALMEARASGLQVITLPALFPDWADSRRVQIVDFGSVSSLSAALLKCTPAGCPRPSLLPPRQTSERCHQAYLSLLCDQPGLDR